MLKRLQFLFKLPTKLSARIKEEQYAQVSEILMCTFFRFYSYFNFYSSIYLFFQAVQDYIHAQRVLERYGNMTSFQGIQKDCEMILGDLKQKLRDQFKNKEVFFHTSFVFIIVS